MESTQSKPQPLISVIVPVFNVEKYLDKCIESIINQSYRNLEIILIDDGSTDQSGQICDAWQQKDSRIKVVHQSNGGLSAARNVGISACSGRYIGFVDSDDWIEPTMYEKLLLTIDATGADICVCKIFEEKKKKNKKYQNAKKSIVIFDQYAYVKKFMKIGSQTTEYYAWNKLYKREVLDDSQYPVGLTAEDVAGTYKALLSSQKIATIDEALYHYNFNPNSITSNFSSKDFDLLKVWDLNVEYTKQKYPRYLSWAKMNRSRSNFTLLYRLAKNFSDKELRKDSRVLTLLKDLKKEQKQLLNADISLSRKVAIFLFCKNYFITAKLIGLTTK